jgi:3-deoxy-D-manno-octulosonate 8-phosphate phosphatase (KDO 8-P phosphatase)
LNRELNDLHTDIYNRAEKIRLFVLDVDGVLTDGSIIYTAAGEEIKCFHVRDGNGIRLIMQAGIEVALITGRRSQALAHRAKNLGISQVFQGVRDKLEVLRTLQTDLGVSPEETAVMGDDLVDLPIMLPAGLAVAVADASPEVRESAHLVTVLPGGKGAVREVCEILLKAKDLWDDLLHQFYQT